MGARLIRPLSALYLPVQEISRDNLVLGTYWPNTATTGLRPERTFPVTTITTNQTYSGNGTTINDTLFDGARVSVSGQNITFFNCKFTGDTSANALVTMTNVAASNVQFIDCLFVPKYPLNRNCIIGHDFTLLRCDLSRCTDLVSPVNTARSISDGDGFPINVHVLQSYLHDVSWWTGAAPGDVHPTDTESHNDLIQIVGGNGLDIRGSTLFATYARQYAHWMVTDPNTEPYSSVALHSLADGGPYQGIPQRGITGGALTPGTDAGGRYNFDDLSALMINTSTVTIAGTPTTIHTMEIVFEDNLVRGGNFAINGGGNANPGGGVSLGSFKRNAFIDDQGNYGSGESTETGQTINLQSSPNWVGHVTAPTTGADKNYYVDATTLLPTGGSIVVRT